MDFKELVCSLLKKLDMGGISNTSYPSVKLTELQANIS